MKTFAMKGNINNADSALNTSDSLVPKVTDLAADFDLAAKWKFNSLALCLWTAPYGEINDPEAAISG